MVTGRISDEEKKIIKRMREQRKSYGEIAKVLNCKKDRVKEYCRSNGLGGFTDKSKDPNNSFELFLQNLERQTKGKLKYISGYNGSDSKALFKCTECEQEFIKSVQFVRRDRGYKCPGCIDDKKQKNINKKAIRSEVRTILKDVKLIIKQFHRVKEYECICKECGKKFISERKGKMYCSKKCYRKHANRKDLKRISKLKENGPIDHSISLTKLITRDKNKCKICGYKVDTNDFNKTKEGYFIAGNNYPSIDHILPVAKGGTHTWDNVQLAHRGCNTIKSDNINQPIQLKLFEVV